MSGSGEERGGRGSACLGAIERAQGGSWGPSRGQCHSSPCGAGPPPPKRILGEQSDQIGAERVIPSRGVAAATSF